MATPHIKAENGDFAETVLMPGDPLRAQFIAENFMTDAIQVNTVRGMLGYTGTYQGHRLSVMGSGMGIPSMSIYSTELITQFGVKNLIRIGSCGALQDDIQLKDVIIAMGASTDSGANRARVAGYDFAAIADYHLLECAVGATRDAGKSPRVGNVFSADLFYTPVDGIMQTLAKMGILAVEMEAAGLYGVAAEYGANALAILTVSDHIIRHEAMSADERQTSFSDMMEVALNTAIRI